MDIKLKLKIKDVEIELSAQEAKDLLSLLDGLVGPKEKQHYWTPYYPYWPTVTFSPHIWHTTSGTPYKISDHSDTVASWRISENVSMTAESS